MDDNMPMVRVRATHNIRIGRGEIIIIDDDNQGNSKEHGYVPNYPKPIDTNPFNLIEGNENKMY